MNLYASIIYLRYTITHTLRHSKIQRFLMPRKAAFHRADWGPWCFHGQDHSLEGGAMSASFLFVKLWGSASARILRKPRWWGPWVQRQELKPWDDFVWWRHKHQVILLQVLGIGSDSEDSEAGLYHCWGQWQFMAVDRCNKKTKKTFASTEWAFQWPTPSTGAASWRDVGLRCLQGKVWEGRSSDWESDDHAATCWPPEA